VPPREPWSCVFDRRVYLFTWWFGFWSIQAPILMLRKPRGGTSTKGGTLSWYEAISSSNFLAISAWADLHCCLLVCYYWSRNKSSSLTTSVYERLVGLGLYIVGFFEFYIKLWILKFCDWLAVS
jgi:hypothetical protein